jgi:hypothetical protein
MLFNTAWKLFNTAWNKTPEVKPVAEMLSTTNLAAWLEKQPADEAYDYKNPYACLLVKYFRAHGESVRIGQYQICGGRYGDGLFNATDIPRAFFEAVTHRPHTYGAALKRLKAVA